MAPKIGSPAPAFKAQAVIDGQFKTVSLEDYKVRRRECFSHRLPLMPIARGSPVFLLPLLLALFPSFLSPLLRLRDPGVCLSLVRKKRPFGSLKQRPKRKKTTKKKEESIEAVRSIACPVQGAGDLNLNLRKNQKFLKNRQGKYVVLFFYPLDFTFVCPTGKEKSGERREEEIESEGERRERKRRASERGSLERNRAQPFPPPPPSKRKKKKPTSQKHKTEIIAFSDRVSEFRAIGAEVVGVSVDSHFSHLAWIETPRERGGLGGCGYPLVADITKSISSDFGVLIGERESREGTLGRGAGLFLRKARAHARGCF